MSLPLIGNFFGYSVIITDSITKNVQNRTHKKKRINKKWFKRYGTKSVPDDTKFFITGSSVIMTSGAYEKLRKQIEEKEHE